MCDIEDVTIHIVGDMCDIEHVTIYIVGDMCDIEHVTTIDALEDKHRNSWGLDYFHERIHLITLKN